MSTDIIEMFWGCLTCQSDNLGRFKTCQNCGKPRSEKSPEWLPDDISPMAAVRNSKLLNDFQGGTDWSCIYCQSSQFRVDGRCAQCGAEQVRSMDELSGACGSSTQSLTGERETVLRTPKSKAHSTAPKVSNTIPPVQRNIRPPDPWTRGKKFGAAVALAGALCLFLFLLLRSRIVDVQVQSTHWTRSIAVSRYQVRDYEGWDPGSDAFDVHDQGQRVHHYDHVLVGNHREAYQEQYACGQDCVPVSCYTTQRSCVSNRNGSATCTGGDRVCPPDLLYDSLLQPHSVQDRR